MPSVNEIFRAALALVGREVIVELTTAPGQARGRVTNAMFDSLLLESEGKARVIPFTEIRSLIAPSPAS